MIPTACWRWRRSAACSLAGIVVFYPWLDHFARFIVRISGTGSESAVSRLDPTLVEAGGEVALEAAWRATLEVAHGAVDAIRRRLAGEPVTYNPPAEGTEQIDHFLESLPLETTDLGTIAPPVRLSTLDHQSFMTTERIRRTWQPPRPSELGVGQVVEHHKGSAGDNGHLQALEDASKQLNAERKTGREKMLEDVALQRIATATARAGLETLVWADLALYHAWRLAESLRIASGK
jgi:phosphate:Na+ symporter